MTLLDSPSYRAAAEYLAEAIRAMAPGARRMWWRPLPAGAGDGSTVWRGMAWRRAATAQDGAGSSSAVRSAW